MPRDRWTDADGEHRLRARDERQRLVRLRHGQRRRAAAPAATRRRTAPLQISDATSATDRVRASITAS